MTAARLALEHDDLQKLLGPLQSADPSEFQDHLGPEAPSLDDTLQWNPDGLPTWWPESRDRADGGQWSPSERRKVLLHRLTEHLPPKFPAPPQTPAETQRLVDSLRLTYDALRSGASRILSSL